MNKIGDMRVLFSASIFLGAIFLTLSSPASAELAPQTDTPPTRILHVMSYHTPWRWTEGQLEGFKTGLGGIKAEFKVFELDTKRHSEARQKAERGAARRPVHSSSNGRHT